VEAHNPVLLYIRGEGVRRQPPSPRPQEYYRGYENIADSDGLLVFHHLPHATLLWLPFEDPHADIAKVGKVCKSCVGRPDMNMDGIELRVFPLSLTGESAIWFTDLPCNSIFTWNQLRDSFLPRYYPVSKKLNHKDRANNFVALPGESDVRYWKNTSAVRSAQNLVVDDLHEEMAQMIIDLGLVLKHVVGVAEKLLIKRIGAKVNETKVGAMVIITARVIMSEMGITTAIKTSIGYGAVEDMMHKLMRRFDASDEHTKELRNDLAVNTRQPGTVPSNTVKNLKNDRHCMTITTRGGKQTIDPPLPSGVEKVIRDDDTVVDVSGELEDKTVKDVEVPQNVTPMPRPPPPISHKEALKQIPGYAKFKKKLVTKKRSVTFEDDDRMQHYSAIFTRSLVQKKEDPGAFTIPCTIRSMRQSGELQSISSISYIVEESFEVQIEERLGEEALAAVIMNFDSDGKVWVIGRGTWSSVNVHQVENLVKVLKSFKRAIWWTIADIIGIPPIFFSHKIQIMPYHKPSINHQRCLNPPMHEVVKKEIIQWLDAGVIYSIADSSWDLCVQEKAIWIIKCTRHISEMYDVDISDMVDDTIEVLMYDFSVVGDSFQRCLSHLSEVLKRYEDCDLVLNCKKSTSWLKRVFTGGSSRIFQKLCILCANCLRKSVNFILMNPILRHLVIDLVAHHLSPLEDEVTRELRDKTETNDTFPDEHVLAASQDLIPWFANFANYLASDIVPPDLSFHQMKKSCADGIIRRCVPEDEMLSVLEACHSSPVGGHHSGIQTANKILQCGYYWPTSTKILMSSLRHVIDAKKMAMKKLKMDWNEAAEQRLNGLNELEEFFLKAYESCVCFWANSSPDGYLITKLFHYGAVELENKEGVRFKVNGQRIKIYMGHTETDNELIKA
ncbi:hypothetical protein EJD97_013572, partial [Solanum chilense]